MTLIVINKFCDKLMDIRLDFEDEELQFRQELWHERVGRLLKILDK
jgi:hypothetical protein